MSLSSIFGGSGSGGGGSFLTNLATGYVQNYWDRKAANRQMDFQERMSSTSHQREVADLYASGLNPILSSKYGGASSPTGAISNNTGAILGNTVSTAQQAKRLDEELKLMKQQTKTSRDIGDNNRADAQKKIKEAKLIDVQALTEANRAVHMANSAKAIEYNLQGIGNESEIDKTRYGQVMRYIKRFTDSFPFLRMKSSGNKRGK